LSSRDGDLFVVAFQGVSIECQSLDDAVAVKAASDLVAEGAPTDMTASQLDRLADILRQYSLHAAAHNLGDVARRLRALE
jgi:hypothetical protein